MKTAFVLTAATLLVALANPAGALPGDLKAADLTVELAEKRGAVIGNRLSWSYPDGVDPRDIAYVEIWRFDDLNVAVQLVDKGQALKRLQYTDTESKEDTSLYTIRYVTEDGEESTFSLAKMAKYPRCPVFVVGTNKPYVTGPNESCVFPPPYSQPYWYFALETVQYILG